MMLSSPTFQLLSTPSSHENIFSCHLERPQRTGQRDATISPLANESSPSCHAMHVRRIRDVQQGTLSSNESRSHATEVPRFGEITSWDRKTSIFQKCWRCATDVFFEFHSAITFEISDISLAPTKYHVMLAIKTVALAASLCCLANDPEPCEAFGKDSDMQQLFPSSCATWLYNENFFRCASQKIVILQGPLDRSRAQPFSLDI